VTVLLNYLLTVKSFKVENIVFVRYWSYHVLECYFWLQHFSHLTRYSR